MAETSKFSRMRLGVFEVVRGAVPRWIWYPEEYGLCKLLVAPDHKILGCHIVGYQASVLLHAVLPIMKWRNDIHSLVDIIYIHPSLAEVVRGAARTAAGMLPTSCRDMAISSHN